jgi:hypothetical protein
VGEAVKVLVAVDDEVTVALRLGVALGLAESVGDAVRV